MLKYLVFSSLILRSMYSIGQKEYQTNLTIGIRQHFEAPHTKMLLVGIVKSIEIEAINCYFVPFANFGTDFSKLYSSSLGLEIDYAPFPKMKGLYFQGAFSLMFANQLYKNSFDYGVQNGAFGVGYIFDNSDRILVDLGGSLSSRSAIADFLEITFIKNITFSIKKKAIKRKDTIKCPKF